jgi:hypothetical protein
LLERAGEEFEVHVVVGPALCAGGVDHRLHHAARAADMQMAAGGGRGEHRAQVEPARRVATVVHQRAAERANLVDVGRGFFAARGVEEVEGLAFGRERTRHAQQRRDADAARDEQRWHVACGA